MRIVMWCFVVVMLLPVQAQGFGGAFVGEDGKVANIDYMRIAARQAANGTVYVVQPVQGGEERWVVVVLPIGDKQELDAVELVDRGRYHFVALDSETAPRRTVQAKGQKCRRRLLSGHAGHISPQLVDPDAPPPPPETREEKVEQIGCENVEEWLKDQQWPRPENVGALCRGRERVVVALIKKVRLSSGVVLPPIRVATKDPFPQLEGGRGRGVPTTRAVVWVVSRDQPWMVDNRPVMTAEEFEEAPRSRRKEWPTAYASTINGVWKKTPDAALLEFKGRAELDKELWRALGVDANEASEATVTRVRVQTNVGSAVRWKLEEGEVKGQVYRAESLARYENPPGRCEDTEQSGWSTAYTEKSKEPDVVEALITEKGVQTSAWKVPGAPQPKSKEGREADKKEKKTERKSKPEPPPAKTPEPGSAAGCQTTPAAGPGNTVMAMVLLLGVVAGRRRVWP